MPTKRTKRSGSSVTSEQTTKTHEFVTIMNPNEIRDPLKQKLIRQHARRREDSNSTFRKTFKLVFDLPSGDTQTAVEGPITGSHSMLSAVREHLDLTPFVPSIQFLRPLTPVRGLVFASPHSPEMDIRVVQLVDFMRSGGDKKFCPLMDFWWNIAQLDSAAFFVTLAHASRLINKQHPNEPKQSSEAVELYTKSIQCLQKRLQMPKEGTSDGVIITILEFAYYDDLVRWLVHMSGLAEVVKRRGGIGTLYSSEIILLLNFWIDISGSFIFDIAPFFPRPHHLLTQVASKAVPSTILQRWNAKFPELSDITTFLIDAASLTSYIDERAIEGVIWKDDMFVSRTFNGVVHQLLSLQRDTEALEAGITSPQIVMREAMRRACIILFALLRDKFSVHPSGMSQHSNSVKELLSQHPVDWSGFSDLHLWVLVTTSFAIEDDKISWYMDEIRGAAVQLGISGWNDVVEVMKSVLWMGKTFRTRNDLLKDFFELSTVINEV
ncbi:hypothetical protein L207DRAFT_525832 [Hyaloscypha variabilis F]|uniref:Tachykinin family protein n=1 Tax=Hyaloscypha variabilis (strain UAMH 11265 / GT02V1 / F) TaxID=1149755 RepID=A0A2J6S1A3_HYAVF|nr:hypothetical protein L207DRAFT_525832 [Hyaloscypha variabilis F]